MAQYHYGVILILLLMSELPGILLKTTGVWGKAIEVASSERCVNTYNIQEYHVHGKDRNSKEIEEYISKIRDKNVTSGEGSSSVRASQRFHRLQFQLLQERKGRLEDLIQYFTLIQSHPKGDTFKINATALKEIWFSQIKRLQRKVKEDAIHLSAAAEVPQVVQSNFAEHALNQKPKIGITVSSKQNKPSSEQAMKKLENKVKLQMVSVQADMDNKMHTKLSEIKTEFNEKLALETNVLRSHAIDMHGRANKLESEQVKTKEAYGQLLGNLAYLKKQLSREKERTSRLQMFHRSELQKLKWKISNETDLWQAGIQYLEMQLFCSNPRHANSDRCGAFNTIDSQVRKHPNREVSIRNLGELQQVLAEFTRIERGVQMVPINDEVPPPRKVKRGPLPDSQSSAEASP